MKYTFNKEGLIPVITQDSSTNEVLMLAYMNQEAIDKTLKTKDAYYFSRSRQALWRKGETSGNTQIVQSFFYDCDKDTILLKVKQIGPACHTGEPSCFYRSEFDESTATNNLILTELYSLIQKRKEDMPKDSYTTYLFEKGVDKILKKVAEETGEVIIAAKNNNEETIYEIGDLLYHLLVLMVSQGIELTDVYKELVGRKK